MGRFRAALRWMLDSARLTECLRLAASTVARTCKSQASRTCQGVVRGVFIIRINWDLRINFAHQIEPEGRPNEYRAGKRGKLTFPVSILRQCIESSLLQLRALEAGADWRPDVETLGQGWCWHRWQHLLATCLEAVWFHYPALSAFKVHFS